MHHLLSLLQSLGSFDLDGLHHRRLRLLFLLRQLPFPIQEGGWGRGDGDVTTPGCEITTIFASRSQPTEAYILVHRTYNTQRDRTNTRQHYRANWRHLSVAHETSQVKTCLLSLRIPRLLLDHLVHLCIAHSTAPLGIGREICGKY